MIYLLILGVIVFLIVLIIIIDLINRGKKNRGIKCNTCGSLDTVIKNNDVVEKWYSYELYTQGWHTSVQHNPPSFYCNQCKKEYDIKMGTWVRKNNKKL